MAKKKKPSPGLKAREEMRFESRLAKVGQELKRVKTKYRSALDELIILERQNEALVAFSGPAETFKISPKIPVGDSESTAFMIASDWHLEEEVEPSVVNELNKFNIDIAYRRATQFFRNGLRLVEINRQATVIKTLVLALLGDFFSNDIHEELMEINQLLPIDAANKARELLTSGIVFLLENGKFDEIVIPCHSGNHARTTLKNRIATERGHSLEYMVYASLAREFKNEPRLKFLLADGYHSYIEVYGRTIRFHHGHQIRYYGGVGGIYIPVNKAISQWSRGKHADLDVFGHFHQAKHDVRFISNGSLIGYNAFAISIKADFEPPKQAFFLMDRKRGVTIYAPIMFDDNKKFDNNKK
ncbi:MAG: hypothetical protein HYW71_00700 [Candidatus Niyogibacteria bacterium]|nr:hypothetical protein [Candidatus Niyogibacteria bacterium]